MRRKVLFLLLPLFFFSAQLLAAQYKLLVLGDSLSAAYGLKQEQGWVTLLQNAWKQQNIDVVNGAISGDTTDGGLGRLPRLLQQTQPTHLLIELGGNDGLQGYPVNNMKKNLAAMIELAQKQGVDVFLQQMRIPTNYGARYTSMFEQSYVDLAEQYQVPLIPFLLENIALNPELMQRDSIHPKAEAQPKISEFMREQLEPYILTE
ncbi:arylesterase [Neptunicella sp. SCSIO 80796]|uniref:arylesterase n=1 Tax=Neptunicella plasticusilytica TaxID=3117012 RepID=UPI003A4E62AD